MPKLSEEIRKLGQRFRTLRDQAEDARRQLDDALKKASTEDLLDLALAAEPMSDTKPVRSVGRPRGTSKRRRRASKRSQVAATTVTGTVRERIMKVMVSGASLTTEEIAAKLPEVHRPSLNTSVSQMKAAKLLKGVGERSGQNGSVTVWKLSDKGFKEAKKLTRSDKPTETTVNLQNVGSLRDQVAAVLGFRTMTARDIVKALRDGGLKMKGNVEHNVRNVLLRNSNYFVRDPLMGRGFYKLAPKTKAKAKSSKRVSRVMPTRAAESVTTTPHNETTPKSERSVAAE